MTAIEALLTDPIATFFHSTDRTEAEMTSLLGEYESSYIRRRILDFVVTQDLDDEHQFMICVAFERLGIGAEKKRLVDMLSLTSLNIRARVLAFEILLHERALTDPDVLETLDRDVVVEFHDHRLRVLLRSIFRDPCLSEVLGNLHESCGTEEFVVASFLKVDALRGEENVPACIAYADMIARSKNPYLREMAVDAVEKEGGIIGRSFLEALRAQAIPSLTRRQIQRCLGRWDFSARGRDDCAAVRAELTWCDESGDVLATFTWERENKRFDSFVLALNVPHGIIMARAALDVTEERCLSVHATKDRQTPDFVAEFAPATAAWLFLEARKQRLTQGLDILVQAEPILARLERIMRPVSTVPLALADPLDLTEAQGFVLNQPYRFWDRDILEESHEAELVARLQFMAQWHRFKGQQRQAEVAEILGRRPALARLAFAGEGRSQSARSHSGDFSSYSA